MYITCGWHFICINFSKKRGKIWMNLWCFTVKHKCMENNYPKLTCTSKSVRVLKPCYIVPYFLFCVSWLLYVLGNQINIHFLKQTQCCGTKPSFISRGQCYAWEKKKNKTKTTLHQKKNEHSPLISTSDCISIRKKKAVKSKSEWG